MSNSAKGNQHSEGPVPVWPDAPRYAPALPFPPYAYVPGETPHPRTRETAHLPPAASSSGERIQFDYGADLYNAGYFWEAHEAWEGVWHEFLTADPPLAAFVQGLILVSASGLKGRTNNAEGAIRLAEKARRRFDEALEAKQAGAIQAATAVAPGDWIARVDAYLKALRAIPETTAPCPLPPPLVLNHQAAP